MEIKNVTINEMEQALNEVNKKYNNNIVFNGSIGTKGKRLTFRLAVKNSSDSGARRGFSGRKMINACWHVHGHYFEELLKINENAVIKSGRTITIDRNGGNWQDRNIGSMVEPVYFSEACECGKYNH